MGARPGQLLVSLTCIWCVVSSLSCLALALWPAPAAAEPGPPYQPEEEAISEPAAPEGQAVCPAGELEPFEGSDVAAGEVRLLRGELAETCAALSARLDRVRERAWWSVLEAIGAADQRVVTNEKLTKLVEDSGVTVVEPGESPVAVEDSALASSSADIVESVDASGEAVKAALWFLAGAAVAALIGAFIYKQVMPRA